MPSIANETDRFPSEIPSGELPTGFEELLGSTKAIPPGRMMVTYGPPGYSSGRFYEMWKKAQENGGKFHVNLEMPLDLVFGAAPTQGDHQQPIGVPVNMAAYEQLTSGLFERRLREVRLFGEKKDE